MADVDDTVTLRFPASTDRVRLARTLVATLGDDAGFDYDEVEDLRIAVDELCFVLIDACGSGGTFELAASAEPGALEVTGQCVDAAVSETDATPPSELTKQILATVVDEYDLMLDGGSPQFRFRKSKP